MPPPDAHLRQLDGGDAATAEAVDSEHTQIAAKARMIPVDGVGNAASFYVQPADGERETDHLRAQLRADLEALAIISKQHHGEHHTPPAWRERAKPPRSLAASAARAA